MDFQHIDSSGGQRPEEMAEHFQGQVRIQPFPSPFADGPAIFAVHFDAGSRTKPHRHQAGQVLIITAGQGVVGGETGRQLVEVGAVVVVAPGEWHWHGATPISPMTHMTVQMSGPDSVDWEVEERDWGGDCDG